VPHYPPLYWPDETECPDAQRGWFNRFLAFGPTNAERHLTDQIAARGPVPASAWGDDPDRAALAREVSTIIADILQWPNAHFIPEDPLRYVLYVIGGDDLEYTEIAMGVEETLGCEFHDEDFDLLESGTYGELIDRMLTRTPSCRELLARMKPYPAHGADSFESKRCPSLAAFIDLREFNKQPRFRGRTKRFDLNSPIRRAIPASNALALHCYICQRYGLSTSPYAFRACRDTLVLGTTATAICTTPFLAISVIAELGYPGSSAAVWALPMYVAAFGFGVTALATMPRLLKRIVSIPRTKRIRTVRDLVEWIIRERSRLQSQSGQEYWT
jgi:acyl carrier protein